MEPSGEQFVTIPTPRPEQLPVRQRPMKSQLRVAMPSVPNFGNDEGTRDMNRRHILIGGGSLAALGAGATWLGLARLGSSSDYADATKAMRAAISAHPEAHEFIRYATLTTCTTASGFRSLARSHGKSTGRNRFTGRVESKAGRPIQAGYPPGSSRAIKRRRLTPNTRSTDPQAPSVRR